MGIENIINSGLTREMLDMTYPDEYYKNTIQPAKAGTGPVPSKMQMVSKFQPFKAMRIGMDPYLPEFMQQGYDKFRAAPTKAVGTAARGLKNFIGSNIASGLPFAYASLADSLQNRLESQGLTGKGGIYDVAGFDDPMSAGASVEYDMDPNYRVKQLSENPAINYDGLYQDPDRFLEYDNSRVSKSGQAEYPFTGNIPTNRRARYDARAYNKNETLPSAYGRKGGTFFENFNPRVGQPSQQEITSELTNPINNLDFNLPYLESRYSNKENLKAKRPELNLRNKFGNLKDKVGEGFNFAKELPGMILSKASGIPFAGQILSGLGNMFEDRQLGGGDGTIVDEFGRSYTADELNSQNALGGYYTDAARSSRRRNKSIEKMMKRQQEDGLSRLGQKRLEKLKAQKAIEDQARTAQYGKTNYGRGAGGQSYSNMGTQGFGVAAGGYGGPVSNRTGSGRQGYSQGGLATMFVEKK